MSRVMPSTVLPDGHTTKRKHPDKTIDESAAKRKRVASEIPSLQSPNLQPCEPLLAELQIKYDVKPMSVVSSTSICKHVDKALTHLGRFSFLDNSVLPGIVLLHAKSKAASKIVTISETVRRRIAEGQQKWYQYSVLYEIPSSNDNEHEPSIIEDTIIGDREDGEDKERVRPEGLMPTTPTSFENAVKPAQVPHQVVMVIFISRVPVTELIPFCKTGLQSNAQEIEEKRRERLGIR